MKTVIIGGGHGCEAIIELSRGPYLRELNLDIACVVDPEADAPGMKKARSLGIATCADMHEAFRLPGLELAIELTGSDGVFEQVQSSMPAGMKLIDHTFARVFWDLVNAREEMQFHLGEITDLEERIALERQHLQGLFDTIPDLIAVLDQERHVTKVNASLAEYVSRPARKVVGQSCQELFRHTVLHPHCYQVEEAAKEVFETGTRGSHIWQISEPEEAYWEVTITPVMGQDGRVESVVASWHHLTEQVMLRRQVESAEQQFKIFIDSARDWISIKDMEGRYVIVNPVCARAFGRKPEEFLGKLPEELLPERQVRMIKWHDREVIESIQPRAYDEVFPIEGRDHHFSTVRFPLTDYSGKTIGVCTIARDVTSERELQDEVVQSTKLAAVGKMAAGVAHEINNPLTGVLAFAEDILEEIEPDSRFRGDLKVIIRETMRCRDIVRNLLDFARQEKMNLSLIDPNELITGSLDLVKKLPQFRNITIVQKLSKKTPPINSDRQRMQQVILNLMTNAAEALKEAGTIVLTTDYDRHHDRVVISVEDNGPGIPENLIDKIFEPFFSTKGTNGLGLVVSWGIVERHRGVIEIDTADNGGAIFRIILPVADSEV